MSWNELFHEAWVALQQDADVWGFMQDLDAGVLVLGASEDVARQVLAWELAHQHVP